MHQLLAWMDQLKPADWIVVVYTFVTIVGVVVAAVTIRTNRKMMAANWLFNAHRAFHEDKMLYEIFNELKYNKYKFNCDLNSGDLGTSREHQLNDFLDFVDSVRGALSGKIVSHTDLSQNSIGFAATELVETDVIYDYLEYTDKKDKERDQPLRAWGHLHRRGEK